MTRLPQQAQAQATKSQVTAQESLQLTRNLLRIAVFNISYIRGLFPDNYFDDKYVPALEMKIKKLIPLDPESRRMIDWMEKGVYDALQHKYLRTMVFAICETEEGPVLEEYSFSFSYGKDKEEGVKMDVARTGDKTGGKTIQSNASENVTPAQMKNAACKMVRTLVQLMRTLDKVPDERVIIMKLFYYDDVTPEDYEPPFFKCASEEQNLPWSRTPLKMKIGDVDSKHYKIALKVRSVLDPCDNIQDNDHNSITHDSVDGGSNQADDSSDSEDTTMNAPNSQQGAQDMEVDICSPAQLVAKSTGPEPVVKSHPAGHGKELLHPTNGEGSTAAVLQSYGSDTTRERPSAAQKKAQETKLTSNPNFKEPPAPVQTRSKTNKGQRDSTAGSPEGGPLDHPAPPAGSCSAPDRQPQKGLGMAPPLPAQCGDFTDSQEFDSSQRARKASLVSEPIYQAAKRFRSES